MKSFIKLIWRLMVIHVYIFSGVGRNEMAVEFFIKRTGKHSFMILLIMKESIPKNVKLIFNTIVKIHV